MFHVEQDPLGTRMAHPWLRLWVGFLLASMASACTFSPVKTETIRGRCSSFGGPQDSGMKPDEPVALYKTGSEDPYHLFTDPRRRLGHDLNPDSMYCAMRWVYSARSHAALIDARVVVICPRTRKHVLCHPADWGPNTQTGRVIDLSPGALRALGAQTDDVVVVCLLWEEHE